MEFVEPWFPITSRSEAEALLTELRRELTPGHPLHGLALLARARRAGCDDVLFEVGEGSGRLAVVHLTWSGRRESPPWPSTTGFDDDSAWQTGESSGEP